MFIPIVEGSYYRLVCRRACPKRNARTTNINLHRYTTLTVKSAIYPSHTRTVVRECRKGDDESLWERGKFDPPPPKTPQPMVTKTCVGNYVGNIYYHAKFYPNRFRGFGSAHAWFRATSAQSDSATFFGSWERLQPRRAHRFWHKIRQTTRFRARNSLLGVAKPKPKV